MKSEVLITINYEMYAEDSNAVHPLRDMNFEQIKELMDEIEKKYPGYENFRFEKNWKSHNYGACSEWYELIADPIPSKLQKVLE